MDQSPWALQSLALAQTLQGQLPQATQTYQRLGKVRGSRAVLHGLRSGRPGALRGPLSTRPPASSREGAAADLAAKDPDRAANKLAALAYTELLRHRKPAAIAAAEKALATSQETERPLPRGARPGRGRRAAAGQARRRQPRQRSAARGASASLDHRRDDRAGRRRQPQRRPVPDRSQHPARHLDRSLRAGPRLPARPTRSCRRTRSSIAASPAAARRCRCSSTTSPPSATSRPSTTTRAGCVEGLKSTRAAESFNAYLAIRGQSKRRSAGSRNPQARRHELTKPQRGAARPQSPTPPRP